MEKLGGRKFAATFAVIALGVGVDLFSANGLSTNLMTLLSIALGLYSGANVFKAWKAPGGIISPTTTQSSEVDLTPILTTMVGFQESQAAMSTSLNAINNRLALLSAGAQ